MCTGEKTYLLLYRSLPCLSPKLFVADDQQQISTCSVVLTFESVDQILWSRDHSNKTSSAVFLHSTICYSISDKMKFGIFLEFCSLALLVEGGKGGGGGGLDHISREIKQPFHNSQKMK